jgi:hypothetical protein
MGMLRAQPPDQRAGRRALRLRSGQGCRSWWFLRPFDKVSTGSTCQLGASFVTEQFLDCADVVTVLEQVGGLWLMVYG